MTVTVVCPVHGFARKHCTWHCKPARDHLSQMANEVRQYWYDRRHGVASMNLAEYRCRYDRKIGAA